MAVYDNFIQSEQTLRMTGFCLRSLLKPSLLCAVITTALLLGNTIIDICVTEELLGPRSAEELRWCVVVVILAALVGGVLVGLTLGRAVRKQYEPFLEGGIASFAGVLLGILIWALTGGLLHSGAELFASFVLGLMFLVIGGPVAFITGGFTTRLVAWA